jgi:hypothetical protein|eukprot:COSAG02_NODE_2515_length_8621_cov_13.085074_7_plen_33_part_00
MQPPVDDGLGNPALRAIHPGRMRKNEQIQFYA